MAIFKFRNLTDGQATPVPPGEFTIGRAEDVYVHVEDSSISRHHARLINDDDGFFLEDLGSANGIAVRGAYVTGRVEINLGDLVHIGKVPFRIDPELPGEPSAPPGVRRVDRAYLRKETERLDFPPEVDGETPIPTPISMPIVTPDDPIPAPEPAREPTKSGSLLIRKSVPLPALVRLMESPSKTPEAGSAAQPASPPDDPFSQRTEIIRMPGTPRETWAEPDPEPVHEEAPWWQWAIVFLAGLGVGLIAGLFFAKLFIDMGGKPASLP